MSSSSPARRSAQIAAAAARASVTPPGVTTRGGAPPPAASAPPFAPPSAERLSSHLRVIGGKIVGDGTLGIIGIPDSANGSNTTYTESAQGCDVLRTYPTDRDDRNA